jgi:glucans biosynthesis protein
MHRSFLLLLLLSTPVWAETARFTEIAAQAEQLSNQPYQNIVSPPLPPVFNNMSYGAYQAVLWKDPNSFWKGEQLPYQLEFFHRTNGQPAIPVEILDGDKTANAPYSEDYFTFGKTVLPSNLPPNLGYAGFRIYSTKAKAEVVVFQNATYFRAAGKDFTYGLSGRGIGINTVVPDAAEEFPNFTHFWIEKPKQESSTITLYALMDGPSITGVYQFEIGYDGKTDMEIHSKLFFRKPIAHLCVDAFSSMFWIGKGNRSKDGDFRPEVHDSDGLLIEKDPDHWTWTPLVNGILCRSSVYSLLPKAFGLIQRERNYNQYEDPNVCYHLRPSVLVTPRNDWGTGKVIMSVLNTNCEYNDNTVLYWQPDHSPQPGESPEYDYHLTWTEEDNFHPKLARCLQCRVDYPKTYLQHAEVCGAYVIKFGGGALESYTVDHPPKIATWTSDPNRPIKTTDMGKDPFDNSWRLVVVIPALKPGDAPLNISCQLVDDKGKALTEEVLNTWYPEDNVVVP